MDADNTRNMTTASARFRRRHPTILVLLGLLLLPSVAAADTPCRDAIDCWRQCRAGDGGACTASPGWYQPVDRGPEPALSPPRPRPRYRLEYLMGGRSNIGRNHGASPTGGFELVRRFGQIEIGPGMSFAGERAIWQQQSFLAHARWPLGLHGRRLEVMPRVAFGVVVAVSEVRASVPPYVATTYRAVTPAAELGVTMERRWHRFAIGFDVGGSFHVRQRLLASAGAELEVPPHVEGLMALRVGLLLY